MSYVLPPNGVCLWSHCDRWRAGGRLDAFLRHPHGEAGNMSATDRMRKQAAHVRRCEDDPVALKAVLLTADDAEALCDVADAAQAELTYKFTPHQRRLNFPRLSDALARLDGEDGDG